MTYLLELPRCLRIDDLVFLVSDHGGSWPGWNPNAIGYMAGLGRPRVDGWVPLLAAEQAFPDWETVERPKHPGGATARGAGELRTTVQVTIYELATETPLGKSDNLFLQRRRAEYSQGELAELARVSAGQIGSIESGKVLGMLDTYVRLAGALSLTLEDLLAGVAWIAGEIELEIDAGYKVEFDVEVTESPE